MIQTIEMTRARLDETNDMKTVFDDWFDWKWQIKHTIRSIEIVEEILNIQFPDTRKAELKKTISKFPMAITPYYLSLVDAEDYENDPIFKQCFPDPRELNHASCDLTDPLHEEGDSPVPGITHRYPDRVLFHVSNICSMYCRHCTRKRKVGDIDSIPDKDQLIKGINYIKNTPEVRDVLLSGGDPFLLSDSQIDWLLEEISKIDHVEVIRIGTRVPVVLPFRITDGLIHVLKKYDNLWINTHYNHPKELTKISKMSLKKMVQAGIPLGNQSVLLRDINDCPMIMKKLVHQLVANRVRPYYLYQCDLSEGLEHFRTDIGKGIEIMESLRGHTSGFAIPTYVVDAPGGGGKIPIMPSYLISSSSSKVILRNYEGVITTYQMPTDYDPTSCDLNCERCGLQLKLEPHESESKPVGIAKLLCQYEESITIVPQNLERDERRQDAE
ncbi:lysine 2,3-aminomutase [Eubacteriaceae bacterium ES2]|nr:lysine 2,3-aminomutase [Eubacteriaceae bacterium ES2]